MVLNKRYFILVVLFFSVISSTFAQNVPELQQPRLVVGIVVDQMRWDYLTRYYERYQDGGFRRLMAEGYNCNRLNINYLPTVTAVGHTAVYTGTVPAFNGIISNTMYFDGKWDSPVRDNSVEGVGTDTKDGKASPHRIMCTTMTDELRLATNFRSKVISVSIKDRGAIIPGGHCANAAYWMDTKSLDFVSSTYYMDKLPKWVKDFNKKKLAQHYLEDYGRKKDKDGNWEKDFWQLLYPADTYVQSAELYTDYYDERMGTVFRYLPQGNTYTADMALAALENEQLGKNPAGVPDFLCMSFSCTDMIGHKVGPNAPWIEDTYLRLDLDIKRVLDALDSQVGKDNYIVFLTADHAGSHNVLFRQQHNLPAGTWPYYKNVTDLNAKIKKKFDLEKDVFDHLEDHRVFFDDKAIKEQTPRKYENWKQFKKAIVSFTINEISKWDNVAYVFEPTKIPDYIPEPVRTMCINGYCPSRPHDIMVVLEQGITEDYEDGKTPTPPYYHGKPLGTNHAVWSPYDAHIPFVVMGKGVHHAWDNKSYTINDIAPTICALLNIQQPSACIGNVIEVSK